MILLKKLKNNLFLVGIVFFYIALLIINPEMGVQSIKNSSYYIKEMFMIMPIVFVLTALLDMWVPKETIMKYLGKKSQFKGVVLSFVMGSISAGPIYAAFPVCTMLLKKGASIKNIAIILSSWAVIKIPMLINEVKFLGIKFMLVRWILTVIAIIILSILAEKIVKIGDIPEITQQELNKGISINHDICMGCTMCTKKYPELFQMQGKNAYVKYFDSNIDEEKLEQIITSCPVKAITYID